MLELLLCSLLTIVPDYLFRRYVQGKRIGKEITFYSVWFELRWGITACLILTVCLITVIFYNHPSTTNVTLFFRTVPIVPETNGRVAEVYVGVQRSGRPKERRSSGWTVRSRRPLWRLRGARSRRSRRTLVVARDRHPEGGRPDPGGQERPPAGRGRTGDQAGAAPAQSGQRRRCARSRGCRLLCEGRQGGDRCRHGRKKQAAGRGSRRFSRPKRPAPKPRWPRPKWSWRRPSSVPA